MDEFPSPPEEAIALIGELGFDGFEIIAFSRDELQTYAENGRVRQLVALYESFGMQLSELVVDTGALKGLARSEPEYKKDALDTLDVAASVLRDLGGKILNFVPNWPHGISAPHRYLPSYIHPVVPGAQPGAGPTLRLELPPDFSWELIWENYIESLAACSDIAKRKGIRIALEGHPLTILSNSDSFLRLFDQLDVAELGVNFDAAMLAAIHREYPPLSIYKLGKKILHVHARDTDGALNYNVPAGSGIVDWPATIESLDQVGFSGFISIELGENNRDPTFYVKRTKEYLEQVTADVHKGS